MTKSYLKKEEEKKRPRNSWLLEVTTGLREKGINNIEWICKEEWKRKLTCYAEKDVKTLILFT